MRNSRLISLVASATIACMSFDALACTRFIYETGTNSYIVGRSMDWAVDPAHRPLVISERSQARRRRGSRLGRMDVETWLGDLFVL